METSNPKSSLVDAIKKSTNILVTVSHNPSVDALAAALGFSLMLNKLEKHATAVFSGAIPPAISFLEPEKNFEGSVSSLRDFIIALDKEKADRLRYKVEGDVVRIYITPYKTTITQKDLDFSEGDFNVDLVIALGVEKQSDLDNAISAHGRILHDGTVATVNLQNVKTTVGSIDWNDEKASSLCEMLMSLSEALQSNLLDEQIATALLTGIVAATDRFSNEHTSPRVMTMSAQLMAAGANQQLIAQKLEDGGHVAPQAPVPSDGTTPLNEGASASLKRSEPEAEPEPAPVNDGSMHVHHEDEEFEQPRQSNQQAPQQRPVDTNAKLEQALGHVPPVDFTEELKQATREQAAKSKDWREKPHESYSDDEPMMGGTLNATTSEAEEAKRAEERSHRNHTLLNHEAPPAANPFSSANGSNNDEPDDVDPFANADVPMVGQAEHHPDGLPLSKGKMIQPVTMQPIKSTTAFPVGPSADDAGYSPFPTPPPAPLSNTGLSYEEAPLPDIPAYVPPATAPAPAPVQPPAMPRIPAPQAQQNQTLADLEAEVHAAASASPITNSIDDARNAVTSAFDTQPLSVGGQTTAAPEMVPIPTSPFSAPPPPPLPDFSTLPPLPPAPGEEPYAAHPGAIPQQPPAAPAPAPTPGQFQIPGQ
jgi:hypothetical protein